MISDDDGNEEEMAVEEEEVMGAEREEEEEMQEAALLLVDAAGNPPFLFGPPALAAAAAEAARPPPRPQPPAGPPFELLFGVPVLPPPLPLAGAVAPGMRRRRLRFSRRVTRRRQAAAAEQHQQPPQLPLAGGEAELRIRRQQQQQLQNNNNDDNDDTSTSSTTRTETTTNTTRHIGVECDECGCNPIVGTRYKCVTRRNYDICRQCWQENHLDENGNATIDNNNGQDENEEMIFYAFDIPLSHSQTRQLERRTARRNIVVYALSSLAQELNNDPTIEDVTFHPYGITREAIDGDSMARAAVRRAIAQHNGVKTFHLSTRNCRHDVVDTVIQIVAEGLRDNKSVTSLGMSIMVSPLRLSTSSSSSKLSKSTLKALKDLVVMNETIQYLFIKRNVTDELLENELLDTDNGLAQSKSIRTFRYESGPRLLSSVSNQSKKKIWHTMETNPVIRRICVTLPNPIVDQQYLDLLTIDKKHQWMKRWINGTGTGNNKTLCNDTSTEEEEDVDINKERYNVIVEVLHRQSQSLDVIPILFRLFRSQPDCFLSLLQEEV